MPPKKQPVQNNYFMTKFGLNQFKWGNLALIIGKRGSGKSFLMRYLMYQFKKVPYGIVISGSERVNKFYSKFLPSSYIYYEYDSEVVNNVLRKQEQVIEKNGINPGNRMFIILDDCLQDQARIFKQREMKEIFFNGRHYNCSLFLLTQYCISIPPDFRTNIDWVFLFSEVIRENVEKLYKYYAGMFQNMAEFKKIYYKLTENKTAMVLKTSNIDVNQLDKLVYWIKANEVPDFKVGCDNYWNYHRKRVKEKAALLSSKNIKTL